MMKKRLMLAMVFVLLISSLSYGEPLNPYREGYIEGFLQKIEENSVYVEAYDGSLHQIPMADVVRFQIDDRPMEASDFKVGMEVYGEIKGRKIVYLESYSTELPGYIPPGGKMRAGLIRKIDRDQMIIRLATGKEETYFTSPATVALKRSQNVALSTLYEGDRVKLFFDEIDTTYISRIQIEGDSIQIKDLYKGTLKVSDHLGDAITLEDVEVFRNGRWQWKEASLRIPHGTDFPLYVGSQKIPYKNLKYYQGKTVYMAMKDFFGKEKVEKMLVKSQYESTYSEKIKEINWYTSSFELGNFKNIGFHEGTMVIKNGRLVEPSALTTQADGFIVADGRGSDLMAGVVYVYNEDINNSNIGQNFLYAGRLNTILQDKVFLKDFFVLNQNDWESFDEVSHGEKELFYDNDTFIYDKEGKTMVQPKEFFAKDYAVDETVKGRKNLKDWYGYIYTDGDRICSISLQKDMDSLLRQRTTIGIVENRPADDPLVGWSVYVRDAKDWSSKHTAWMPKNASLRISLEQTMIIKDGKRIEARDLQAGDRLYLVRDDFHAKVIIVK